MSKKQPQDHKKKGAVDALAAEASKVPGIAETENRTLVIEGRLGTAKVTTLGVMDWDADVFGFLGTGDYLSALCGMVSPEDAAILRSVKPSVRAMMTAVYDQDEESGEASVGESQAS